MSLRNIFIFLILFVFAGGVTLAQEKPGETEVPAVYKKIETYSHNRKITSLLHGLLLKPVSSFQTVPQEIPGKPVSVPYAGFEGKIIRSINITTLDPFGYSIHDTTAYPRSFVEKTGNTLHIKTQHFVIRNQLLIHINDPFDSLLVRESERLIRRQSYIHDVAVTVAFTAKSADSVDVYFRVGDLWSIIPDGAMSNNAVTLKLADKNLAGLGHTFSNTYSQNFLNGDNAFSAYYVVPNIKNTYISTRLAYAIDEKKNYNKSLNIERPFFSPVARWAGGISVLQQRQPVWIYKNDTARMLLTSRYNIQDYWGAVAWQVFKGKTVTDRTTKLIFSARIFNIRYLEKPEEQTGLGEYYNSERCYLAGLGISGRKYVEQSYIFRFGTTEDVPVGIAYGVVGGYQLKNHERWYWGLHHSWGNFFKWGYFGTNIKYGTFINSAQTTQGMFTASINYFSGLFTIGNWKFRQFVKPELTIGMNRASYDRLTINDGYGLNGFNSDVLSGTRRFLFILQTQSYAPWNLLGFRFGPFINLSFGMLGNETTGFAYSRLYPQLGMGVLIRNDFLVFNNIQLSFAFYPAIPGNGNNILKANPFRTTDFGFPDFVIGKPEVVDFH